MNGKLIDIKPNMRPNEIAKAYSDYLGLPIVGLKDKKIPSEVIDIIPKDLALSYHIIAYELSKDKPQTLKIAVSDPEKLTQQAPSLIIDLKKKRGINIELAITTSEDFNYALTFYKRPEPEKKEIPPKIEKKPFTPIFKPTPSSAKPPVKPKEEPTVSLIGKNIPYDTLTKFPEEVAQKYQMVVFETDEDSNSIKVALLNPDDSQTKEILEFIKDRNHLKIEKYKTSQKDLDFALALYQQKSPEKMPMGEARRLTKIRSKIPEEKPATLPETPDENEETIPLAKPLPKIGQESSLPPLQPLEEKIEQKPIKLAGKEKTDEIKSEELKDVEVHEPGAMPLTNADNEKDLNLLLPNGIRDKENLIKIIKSGIVPKIVAAIIYYAVELEASDIHLEPTNKDFRLRFRIDGILRDIVTMPLELHPPILSRIKIMSTLKIDEQRVPQDGRFDVVVGKKEIDLRVSTLPTVHGEKAVLRILDKSGGVKSLDELGFVGTNLAKLTASINRPYGIILATGPTGSGKSTTLYAILNKISNPGVNIITLEDPVEYDIPGINQCQVRPKIGFSFADGLRSVLRQDPNIIMVGEIRDGETASMATHAALTGHLVLTTLHTNDAAGALPRLINMGIEPFLITSAINCIIAQRLVRKICTHCKTEAKIPVPVLEEVKQDIVASNNPDITKFKDKPIKFYKGKGCAYCNNGFKGRIGIYEVLEVTAKIEELAVHKRPANDILTQAIAEKMLTMKQDGIIKALEGLTSLEEVLRATSD